jgi:formate hydrogenlyase transcriptional activator
MSEASRFVQPERRSNSADAIAGDEVGVLRYLVEGTARATGEGFFQSLLRHLAAAIDVSHAFVAEFTDVKTRVHTLAYWADGRLQDNIEFDLAGTPCEEVVGGSLCHHPANVWSLFPQDAPLKEMGIESYLGVPLRDDAGEVLGHLAVFDERPMSSEPRRLFTFRIFAARAAAELERLRYVRRLQDSEKRYHDLYEEYRDLYDEAPIGYVKEDLESRFIAANQAALRILGLKPEEAVGMVGMSLVPDTPEAQRRVKEAFASIGRGEDADGVVLELRRKDDGRPVWVQWWSRPEPNGKYTRTAMVDITERVLMEEEKARLQQQNLYLQEEIKSEHNFEELIGRSQAFMTVLDKVRLVAPTDASVLIQGETGTGKELIARAIHSASRRKDKPLIKVNCAALPTALLESELFGHEKGAFTGAVARRLGRFELANGGTLFLDEVGEIPPEAQAKLLRTLQEREIERLGGGAPIRVDVRIIAATNRNLARAAADKSFREDLFYRLNVFPITLPPLRQRHEDIPLLVHFLANKYMAQIGKRITQVSQATMDLLQRYDWPGNVRELENLIERAVILTQGESLEIDEAALVPLAKRSDDRAERDEAGEPLAAPRPPGSLEQVERDHILSALRQTEGVIDGPRGAAKILDMHPNTLRSRMKKLGIKRPPHEAS